MLGFWNTYEDYVLQIILITTIIAAVFNHYTVYYRKEPRYASSLTVNAGSRSSFGWFPGSGGLAPKL